MHNYELKSDDVLFNSLTYRLKMLTNNFKIKWIYLEETPEELADENGKYRVNYQTEYKFYKVELNEWSIFLIAGKEDDFTKIAFKANGIYVILNRPKGRFEVDDLKRLIEEQVANKNYDYDKKYHEFKKMIQSLEID